MQHNKESPLWRKPDSGKPKDGLEIGYTVGSSRISLLPHKQYHEYYGKGLRQYGKVNTFNPVF